MQKKDVVKVPLEAEQDFPKLLKRMRKEKGVYLEQLAEGLMTASQLARIEKGQRPVPKYMRDRLLGRMGVASDWYENLLNIDDCAAWECQRDILCAVERRETQRAWKLIIAYENQEPVNDKIKQQFCLMMEAEVLKQQDVDWCDIAACYEKAAKCTIPDIGNLCIDKKLLSIQEINIVLEYEFYHKDGNFAGKCKALMAFVENTVYDDLSKVKVYPKIVYYYLQEIFPEYDGQATDNLREALQVCNQAVEMLRDTGRAFFLMELLEIRIKILESMGSELERSEELKAGYQESLALAGLLKNLFGECGISAYMQDCTYLYQQRWVFYMGDVLRIRRKMFGLTQKAACQGICSARTLRRAEKREANMQNEYLGALLRRLGLSKEFQRARLVSNDREVLRLRKEMYICRNNRDFDKCRKLLSQMKEKISSEIPENRQYLIEVEASLDWREGKISKEEFVAREKDALQCTLDMKKVIHTEKMYLTELEILCIYKIIQGLEGVEKKKYIDYLLQFFKLYEKDGELAEGIAIFESVIWYIATELGNMGEYQLATALDNKILRECLKIKRMWIVDALLYDILWNDTKQQIKYGNSINKEKMTEELKRCILLSHLYKHSFRENFYSAKLDQS